MVCHNVGTETSHKSLPQEQVKHMKTNRDDGGHLDIEDESLGGHNRQCIFFWCPSPQPSCTESPQHLTSYPLLTEWTKEESLRWKGERSWAWHICPTGLLNNQWNGTHCLPRCWLRSNSSPTAGTCSGKDASWASFYSALPSCTSEAHTPPSTTQPDHWLESQRLGLCWRTSPTPKLTLLN